MFDRETRFEITAEAAPRFEAAIAKVDGDGGKIQRLEAGVPPPPRQTSPDPHDGRQAPPRPPTRTHEDGPARSKTKGAAHAFHKPWAPPLDGKPPVPGPRADRPGKPPKVKRTASKKRKSNG